VPDVLDLVDHELLELGPPRQLPRFFVPNLIGEYLLEQPARAYLDPLAIISAGAALLIYLLRLGSLSWVAWLLVALVALRLSGPLLRLWRNVREDYLLLRDGVVVSAHVIGVRPCRDNAGNPAGAYLDCAIPLTRQRTSVGSVWMPDASDALRIGAVGRVPVICLAHAPGTWRLRDGDGTRFRYEPARQ
jgi:hypothetical protein